MRTILIVEDSETCAETLQIALEPIADFETVVLRSSAAALAMLESGNKDIAAIVTDLNMPRHDGIDLIRRLRADDRYARIAVLLISGDSDPRLPQSALNAGADAFFAKPYSPAEVRRKLEQLLC